MDGLAIERINDASAMALWGNSPHATVFTRHDVLGSFFHDAHWWGAVKGQRLIAAWPVPVDANGLPARSGWFYFVGPIWDGSAFPPVAHRALSATLPVYTGFIESLVAVYGGFAATLPPPQADVRAFSWWRYEQGAPVNIQPRYSARIEGLASRPLDDILGGMRQLRRRELRRALPVGGIEWSSQIEPEELADLYMERVPGEVESVLEGVRRLLDVIRNGAGFTSAARDTDGRLVAAIAVLCDEVMGNVVINSVANDWRTSGVSVHNMVRVLARAQEIGLDRFDFNGANSPNRGDDKHSYGAEPVLYFDVSFTEA